MSRPRSPPPTAATGDQTNKLGESTKKVLMRRAQTTMGFCAVAVVGVGKLKRAIVSYDPNRAMQLVHQALGNEMPKHPPNLSQSDHADWFSLTPQQARRILVAAGLPVVPLDWQRVRKSGNASEFTPEDIYLYAVTEIALLLNDLHVLQIYPAAAARPPIGHAEKLAKASRRFRDILTDKATDRLISDWPELQKLRTLASDLTLIANMTADARHAEARRLRENSSARSKFVRENLAECFETLYGRKAGVSRPSNTGEAGGPFVRFASTFFAEIGLPVAAETIARDLRRLPAKRQVQ